MFRKIYSALKSESTIDKAFSDLTEMLKHGAWMFERANEVLHSTVPAEEVRDAIYERDRIINELERSIRLKMLRYLTINPGHDVADWLSLIIVVIVAVSCCGYVQDDYEVGGCDI